MSWEHFEASTEGECKAINEKTGEIVELLYERGIISTGRSRVFWGYYISLTNEQMKVIGQSEGYSESWKRALADCNRKLKILGLTLLVAGNSQNYSESAMSGGAGYGYLKDQRGAVDIMSSVPALSNLDLQPV
jgi:hypothetical protein